MDCVDVLKQRIDRQVCDTSWVSNAGNLGQSEWLRQPQKASSLNDLRAPESYELRKHCILDSLASGCSHDLSVANAVSDSTCELPARRDRKQPEACCLLSGRSADEERERVSELQHLPV